MACVTQRGEHQFFSSQVTNQQEKIFNKLWQTSLTLQPLD